MAFPSYVELNYGHEKLTTTTKGRTLGTKGVLPNGSVFWYGKAGATALEQGVGVIAKAGEGTNTHNLNLTPSTAVGDWDSTAGSPGIQVGKTTIGVVWVTNHSSGEYTDGHLAIETSPGMGMYRVVEDADSGDSATATTVRLHPDDGIIQEVLTTVTKVALHANPYSSIIVCNDGTEVAALTGVLLGVTPVEVPANNYFWVQTAGPARVRYDDVVAGAIGHGIKMGPSASAGHGLGSPATTVATTAAINTSADQLAYGAFPTIGYLMAPAPDDGDLMAVMLTYRS